MAEEFQTDLTPAYLTRLTTAVNDLTGQITAQGVGVSEKLDHASFRVQKAVDDATARMSKEIDKAAEASERHARSLVRATWALAFATVVLVLITAVNLYIAAVR